MERIIVEKARFLVNKKEIVLRGVAIPDYYSLVNKEKQSVENVIEQIKKLGFNAIRVPVLPGHFIFYEDYIEHVVQNIVTLCKRNNLYCILDWHAIGNPIHNETSLKEYFHTKENKTIFWYCADKNLAMTGWKLLSSRFGNEHHVIFEIFNEPAPGDKAVSKLNLSSLPGDEWRKIALELIVEIRKSSKNLILVSSIYWSFNLKETSKSPLNEIENIAYSFHCYPIKNNANWKEMLESMNAYPVIITEWGFDSDKESRYYDADGVYAKQLLEYCNKKGIGWVAWCFSSSWHPKMVSSWDPFELTNFGKFAIQHR